eukprot:m.64466 g.64466  ORF g.64466 m.64466 type:complete len:212 (-) comp13495_c0_seq1:375-1010(-)
MLSSVRFCSLRSARVCAVQRICAQQRFLSSTPADDEEKKRELEIQALQARNVDRTLLSQLPFNDYIKVRRGLNLRAYAFGVPCFFAGIVGSAFVCATQIPNLIPETPEQATLIMGMDPMLFSTLATTASGFASFFIGVSMFKTIWRTIFKKHAAILDARETDFRLRIARHRRGGYEFSHDYYGDKVKTLSDYRSWLRDQKTAERKDKNLGV